MVSVPRENERHGMPSTPLEVARFFLGKGIYSVSVAYGEKDPHAFGWENLLHGEDELDALFGRRTNNGAMLGVHSGNLLDGDLDCLEAVRAARFFMPPTGMMWGRSRKPRSHLLYRLHSADGVRTKKFTDPTPKRELDARGLKASLVELRFTGHHSLAPGSVNTQDGCIDPVRWEDDADGEPADTEWETIFTATERLAACALLARYWSDGQRHDTALPLAGFLWHGGMLLDDALHFMEAVCVAAQDEQIEARLSDVRDTYRNGETGTPISGGPTLEEYVGEAVVRRVRAWLHLQARRGRGMLGPDGLPLAADGDGDRFAARFVGEVLYCAEESQWYVYNGVLWERDRTENIMERAKTVVREFRALVGARAAEANVYGVGGVASYEECAKYSIKMGSDYSLSAMLHLARSKPELAVTPEQFDADPRMFNVLDCTLDLNTDTGAVSSHLHNPQDLIRRVAVAHYRPDATHELIEKAFARFHPEQDHRAFIEEMGGYCLTGIPKRHGLQLIGPHDAGKSTFLGMFQRTWGSYGASLDDTNLARNPKKGGDVARPDLLRVKDARLVTVAEVDPQTKFDVALFKRILSGGDSIGLRTFFDKSGGGDHVFHCSIWMSGNKEYGLPSDEEAAYARVEVLDCNHVVPEADRVSAEELATTDPNIVGDAVLALAVRGFQRLYGEQQGILHPPASATEAKQAIRENLDQCSSIIRELFIITNDPSDAVKRSEAWQAFRATMEYDGEIVRKPRSVQKAFEEAMAWRVGAPSHSAARWGGNCEYWQGVTWTAEAIARHKVSKPDWK